MAEGEKLVKEFGPSLSREQMLAKGAEVNATASNGATALIVASYNGHLEVVQALLAKGAEVNARAHAGWTALMGASYIGHLEVVQALLSTTIRKYDDVFLPRLA